MFSNYTGDQKSEVILNEICKNEQVSIISLYWKPREIIQYEKHQKQYVESIFVSFINEASQNCCMKALPLGPESRKSLRK